MSEFDNDVIFNIYRFIIKEKQYIEQPYVGIWQVSPDIANRIEEAFSSWFIGQKKLLDDCLASYCKW